MALGDLVQMLEGLKGGVNLGDVPGSTEEADLPWLYCGAEGWNPATNKCNPPAPAKPKTTDWTPWVLGGAALLTVWALFLREPKTNLRGFGEHRKIKADTMPNGFYVSTIFDSDGVDWQGKYNYETMVFKDGGLDEWDQERVTSEADALAAHAKLMDRYQSLPANIDRRAAKEAFRRRGISGRRRW